ncbi:MAG: SulP family inorganic anion transporter [Flavobacteriaceae bacterium]|nr:SulP family inorganic anion transporter [Flavobacteriaceae bacterium]
MTNSRNIKSFFTALPKNIFAGFVVSLIALPLGIGLALASEVPPIAGIVTAVVGGVLVAVLGGSNVTISGPGNGLVGVVAAAVLLYADQSGLTGNEALYEGYLILLAAVICSGLLMLVLGFLRLGKLSNYFPSSAIQGMLAAIGLIILGKQFHIMMGNRISRNGNLEYLTEIPKTIIKTFYYNDTSLTFAMISGVISLIIMVFYAKIRNKYLQLIPAPMWIVLLAIGFSYYYELVLQLPNPIHPDYMISGIPEAHEIISNIPTPNFNEVGTLGFWAVVLSLTLIASIESLLSIKAVDKLDSEKRRSNVNRDIKAIGFANIIAGFLGGLNVVTVIARSSVNVNNGASNRSSNFFHASFLVAFIVLFSTELTRIPLPALMAILVFTGWKLAHPLKLIDAFKIGKEQGFIFLTTLVVTISIGLIEGIVSGIIATALIHLIINKSVLPFIRNILKPNVLMFKETDTNNYYVSVKNFCTFLNFSKLKRKLDTIPETEVAIIDFSWCDFIDHTVMENMSDYKEIFRKKGGTLEIIGLDLLDAGSKHPFGLRKILPVKKMLESTGVLTNRQELIKTIAKELDYNYMVRRKIETAYLENFIYFKTKTINHTYNEIGKKNTVFKVFDVEFYEGEFIAKEVVRSTMLYTEIDHDLPIFSIHREGLLELLYHYAGFKDIKIEKEPAFSKKFYIKGEDEEAIQQLITPELAQFLLENPSFHIESNGKALLIFTKERLAGVSEIKKMKVFAGELRKIL